MRLRFSILFSISLFHGIIGCTEANKIRHHSIGGSLEPANFPGGAGFNSTNVGETVGGNRLKPDEKAKPDEKVPTGLPSAGEIQSLILANWKNQKPRLTAYVHETFAQKQGRTYSLYAIQGETNALLRYAWRKTDITLLDSLAELYLVPLEYLETITHSQYAYLPQNIPPRDIPEGPEKTEAWARFYRSVERLPHPVRTWLWNSEEQAESILESGQFLFVVSDAYRIFLSIPQSQRTEQMKNFLREYPSVLKEHFFRWIFEDTQRYSRKGWGCQPHEEKQTNQYDFLEKLFRLELASTTGKPNSACNYYSDGDLWVGVGVANFLLADAIAVENGEPPLLSDAERERLRDYMALVTRLIRSRLTESALIDFAGRSVTVSHFDLDNSLADHPENAYAGYSGETYPTEKEKVAVPRIGWDLSHGSRFVYIFTTLFDAKPATNQSWPQEEDMTKIVNQFLYGVFNRNLNRPLFSNYFDGKNGWYRVNYGWDTKSGESPPGTGMAPYGASLSGITSGWGEWYRYNKDMGKVMASLWKMMRSTEMTDTSGNHLVAELEGNVTLTEEGKIGVGIRTRKSEAGIGLHCGNSHLFSSEKGAFEIWVKFDQVGDHEDILQMRSGTKRGPDSKNLGESEIFIKKVGTSYKNGKQIEKKYQNSLWFIVRENGEYKINLYSVAKIEDTRWHHLVFTQDGTGLKVYVDKTASELFGDQNGGNWTFRIDQGGQDGGCKIGGSTWHSTEASAALFDEARFYNRPISGEEVRRHFDGRFDDSEGLIAHWGFASGDVGLVEHKREYYSDRRYFLNFRKREPVELFQPETSQPLLSFLSAISDIVEVAKQASNYRPQTP